MEIGNKHKLFFVRQSEGLLRELADCILFLYNTGMSGFDRWNPLFLICMPRLFIFLANTNEHLISANLVSRVKNAVANAFRVPVLATAVA